jgi:hypothetical protein
MIFLRKIENLIDESCIKSRVHSLTWINTRGFHLQKKEKRKKIEANKIFITLMIKE